MAGHRLHLIAPFGVDQLYRRPLGQQPRQGGLLFRAGPPQEKDHVPVQRLKSGQGGGEFI